MVNKITFKQYLLEAEEKMPRAKSQLDLLRSIVDGHFTKDGSKLKVTGDFDCNSNQLKSLEGCPQTVSGAFTCSHNQLKSLEGCPHTVGGYFSCSDNQLKSLEGCPQTVGGYFSCSHNQLKSLEGCPQTVGGGFNCSINQLKSLEGCPQTVGGDFTCGHNQLKSLEGCPQTVGGNFWCGVNQLKSLEGCPQTVDGNFTCIKNKELTSLARINFYVHEINGKDGADFTGCPIKSNILGILKIRGLKKVAFDDKQLEEIMNKYLPMGDSTDCIDDLLDAGYSKEYCKW